jgi:transposase
MYDSWASGFEQREASMAWRTGQAYSQDLRERVLAAVDAGMAVRAAAPLYRVSISYIYKAMIRRRISGEVTARPQRCHLGQKLAAYQDAIRQRVSAQPDATLDELRGWMLASHGVSVSQGGMWNALDRLGLTHKKRRNTRPSSRGLMSPRLALPGANASQT